MGEILNEGGHTTLVHSTFSVQPANQQRRNAAQDQERRAHGQRRQKVPQGQDPPQQAQVQGDDCARAQRREEGLFPAEDHRQHRGQVQDQERLCRQEDLGVDDGQEDDQKLQRQVPPGHGEGEAVRTARRQEAQVGEKVLKEETQDEQAGQEEVQEDEEVEEEEVPRDLEEVEEVEEEFEEVSPSKEVEKSAET